MTITGTEARPDYSTIKAKQQRTWASGDFAVIGTTLQWVGEQLCESVDVSAGTRVIDVAAGNGNATLAAARRGAFVTATDYVPELLEGAQRRADADGVTITTRVADAEQLPYEAATFDTVLSTFGVMFAPDHERAAAEMLRVCRPGGRIGLANWTPDGFVGDLLRMVGRYVAPPAGVASPLAWGTKEHVGALFGTDVTTITITPRHFVFRYRSAEEFARVFCTYYGPTHMAFESLDPEGQDSFEHDLIALARNANESTRGALAVPSEYLEIVATRA